MKHVFNLSIKKSVAATAFVSPTAPNLSLMRFCSKESPSETGRQLGGFEYKEEIESFKSRWRTPYSERQGFWKSKFDLFANRNFAAGLTKYNPANFKFFSLKEWLSSHSKEKLIFDQKFIEERLIILGTDLAAAHFVVYRGGAVKFSNLAYWIKDDKEKNKDYDEHLPNRFNAEYILESIDLSKTRIVFEGLKNIENLRNLKWLSFAQCPYFDNWCLDRVSGQHGDNLEYLDISYTNVSHHGLSALYRFKKLKVLKVEHISEDPEFVLVCLKFKQCFPELTIEGIPDDLSIDSYAKLSSEASG